jgi:predicted dehydrogenase
MKISIIGMGGMGSTHYNMLRKMDDLEIVALVDIEEARVLKKAAQCGARAYTDINDMLSSETPDILIVCTPSYLHCQHAVAAMEKGIHVLTEKPAALCAKEIKAMLKCSKDNNVMFMVAFVLRFWQEYIWLKNAHSNNTYGKLLDLNMWRIGQGPLSSWQNWMLDKEKSGLVSFDLHIHDIDFMVYMLGVPVKSEKYEIIENSTHYIDTTCYYECDVRVRSKAAWYTGSVPFQMGYEALFEKGFAIFNNDALTYYPNDGEPIMPENAAGSADSEINVSNTSGYYNELRYFIDCVRSGNKPSIISEDELLATLSLLES